MPRRNLIILLVVAVLAIVCYQRVQRNPYAQVMARAMAMIENKSLEPVKEARLFEGAMDGMLSQLDEHSTYISPADLPEFQESIDLQFAGVGMELAVDPETKGLVVVSPLVGSPAYKAGILAGDRILRIGKTSAEGMSVPAASVLLRGKLGESVTLLVSREGEKKPKEITLVREMIQVQSVIGDTRNADGSWNFVLPGHDSIGYIRITSFTDDTAAELEEAIAHLLDHGMRGLVLDLRDDPGGYLASAIEVCDLFLDSGVIVTPRRRGGEIIRAFKAGGDAPYADLPIAVLVNQQTASAAEIVSACLQDNDRAVVVGQRSFGKGTVQDIIPLGQEYGAMKLTTASYWRPSGKNIQRPRDATAKDRWGVSPNKGCEVVYDKDEFARWQGWRAARDLFKPAAAHGAAKKKADAKAEKPFVDRQLQWAVEYVEKEVKKRIDKPASPKATKK
jgi:carboxyl-terminal processing protease